MRNPATYILGFKAEDMGRRDEGFTLLEVLLAVVLLLSGSVFLLQAINTGLFASGTSEQETVAVNLAQEKMESEMNSGYANVSQESPAAPVPGFTRFSREVLVATPQTDLKRVTVNISWIVKSSTETVSLVSYISNV